jgi:aminopeptidase-like protein
MPSTERLAPDVEARASARARLERYFDRLWPICRSIMGPGFRASLDIVGEIIPFERLRFPTGARILDWEVPEEWEPREAYLVGPDGTRRAEFRASNLHLVSHSVPFSGRLTLDELRPHLFSSPERPEAIPYRTSYYEAAWGFCLRHDELTTLPDGVYQVVVDTALRPGHLVVGEAVLPGQTDEEVLFCSYLCHPSLAHNELSGPLVLALLWERLAALPRRRYTYRFVIGPETIGAVAYLSVRGDHLRRTLRAGWVVTCVGDAAPFTYKRSRRGDSLADRAATLVLRDLAPHTVVGFDPADGTDERQYGSPGFDLPVGSLMRTPYGRYPEYHTSLDNGDLIDFEAMLEVVEVYAQIVAALEANDVWRNRSPLGEPQLGRRGIYPGLGGGPAPAGHQRAMMWLLNLADGTHDLLDIADRSGLPVHVLADVARTLQGAGLLARVG